MKAKQRYIILSLSLLAILSPFLSFSQTTNEEPVIPNVFTPNKDGVNDVFKIDNLDGSWELMIFDRFGSLVYATQQAQGASWNGINIQGLESRTGVYFYTLKSLNNEQTFSGSLHLFR